MSDHDHDARQAIASLISQMNEHWVAGEAEPIGAFLHENMVIAAADGAFRGEGRDVCLQSIADFLAAGTILDFNADDPIIDVFDATAIASYNFSIRYRMSDKEYAEKGTDVLVLNRTGDDWKIVWRTTNSHALSDD